MTNDQLESIRAARLQLLDHGDEAAAKALDWVLTAEPSGWRPIETAPKGGTPILVSNGETVAYGWWMEEDGGVREIRDTDGTYIDQIENNCFNGWMDNTGGMLPDPTHWMPLPQPPEA